MRYTVHSSKLYAGSMLVILVLFAFGVSRFWDRLPLTPQILFGVLITAAVAAVVFSFCSTRPVIIADEDGLLCYKIVMKKIPWRDVVAAIHVPRVEKLARETHFAFSEKWRSIDVYIANIDQYAGKLSAFALGSQQQNPNYPDYPGCTRLRIVCSGTTANSLDLYNCINRNIEAAKLR